MVFGYRAMSILYFCYKLISIISMMSCCCYSRLLYCMEYIEHHLGTVLQLLKERLGIIEGSSGGEGAYLLFDLPGQIELTAHSNVVSRIAQRLVRELDLRLVCVQLVDAAVCCTDVSKFIGAALVCTASMMRLGEHLFCDASFHFGTAKLLCVLMVSLNTIHRITMRQYTEQNGSIANEF